MGCGQSKINIYPRKSKGKNSAKKSVSGDKPEGEEEESGENEQDTTEGESNEGCDEEGKKKPARTKPVGGGQPLLAQTELSNSQQNFFKMLDEKIENGPDYDSNDETEIALETARLHSLLKDWETASASSRSLPPTPRHLPRSHAQDRPVHSAPKPHSRIPPNVIHQSYGVTPPISYRQNYNPGYQTPQFVPPKISPGIQYHQQYSQGYQMQQDYPVSRHYQSPVPTSSPIHYQPNNSPKKYTPPNLTYVQNSPPHKIYTPQNQSYTNGELIIQQQLYNQQIQYQQSREYQQYRQSREQLLVQQQICGSSGVPQGGYVPQSQRGTHYQSSVHVPIVAVLPQTEQSPKMSLQRKQRHYSQEMT